MELPTNMRLGWRGSQGTETLALNKNMKTTAVKSFITLLQVYITGRSEDLLKKCADEINQRGGKAFPVVADHSKDEVTMLLNFYSS